MDSMIQSLKDFLEHLQQQNKNLKNLLNLLRYFIIKYKINKVEIKNRSKNYLMTLILLLKKLINYQMIHSATI
jgi:hypothetical protein